MKFRLIATMVGLWLASVASAQTSTPDVQTFSLSSSAVSLPGGGKTVAATDAGATFNVTTNFQLRDDNILASDSSFRGYFGGFNYFLPVLGGKLNNASPNLNGSRFHFYLTGSAGVDQAFGHQHYAFLGGGGVFYDLTASGKWTFGGEARYAKLPGYANNTAIVSIGPAFHF